MILNYTKKPLLLFLLSLILLIPLFMFSQILDDREWSAKEAINKMGQDWGSNKGFNTPYISNSYMIGSSMKYYPTELNTTINLVTQERKKGIYEAVLYHTKINFQAKFLIDSFETEEAFLEIENTAQDGEIEGITINGIPVDSPMPRIFIQQFLDIKETNTSYTIPVLIQGALSLRGYKDFQANLNGKNQLTMQSNWQNPSFSSMLPDKYTLNKDGFIAHYNFNSPNKAKEIKIDFYQGVDNYRLIQRAVKYAYLFIVLTLLALYLCEIASRKNVILLQYGIIGASLVTFYLTLLSLSEYLDFIIAYILATLSIVVPITLYTNSIMGDKKFANIIGCIMIFLYGSLLLMLYQNEYALLIGTFIVMFAVYIAMYLTRHTNKS